MTTIIPSNCHTVFVFNLPFAVPVPDGIYEVKMGLKVAKIALKRIQRKNVAGFKDGKNVQLKFDKYGKSSYSTVNIRLPWIVDFEEKGRTSPILGIKVPRPRVKDILLRFLNRFIETSRFVTGEYWIEPARYQDLLSIRAFYFDGKNQYPVMQTLVDTRVGGEECGAAHPFDLSADKKNQLIDSLKKEIEVDLSKILLLNSKDACLQEDFRLAIIEAVAALEIVLYRFIKYQGNKLEISVKLTNSFIKDAGLTGNISEVLKMLTSGFEQIDSEIIQDCKGAIKIRNKIIHQGFRDVHSTDTEKRVISIGQMIDYLDGLIIK